MLSDKEIQQRAHEKQTLPEPSPGCRALPQHSGHRPLAEAFSDSSAQAAAPSPHLPTPPLHLGLNRSYTQPNWFHQPFNTWLCWVFFPLY